MHRIPAGYTGSDIALFPQPLKVFDSVIETSLGYCKLLLKMAQSFVDAKIRDNKVVVFSKTYCPYCTMAKSALASTGVKYDLIELDNHDMGAQIQEYLKKITGASSVPRVFIGGNCIGGGSETKALKDSGKLVPLLKENGAL